MIKIVPIPAKGKDLRRFIDFPHDLNEGDSNYVPELFMAQRDLLNPAKHPFFLHSEMQLFLAYKDGKIVGRIAAILNNNNNTFNNSQDGFFGFFDCINDQDIAGSLLDVAKAWLIGKGMKTLIGPVNPSTNEACGLLIEGFDTPPKIMMPYNKAYYSTLLENYGLKKKVDLLAHALYKEDVGDKPVRLYDALVERLKGKGIIIRKIDLGKRFKEELASFGNVYNAAWDKNMGFVPLTKEEFEFMGKDLKLIADPDYCLVAEHDGKVVGVSLCLPDINQVLIKVKRGRLFPTGIFKLLLGKGKVNALRVMALGVLEPYRKMGIEACFYAGIMKKGIEKGIVMAEASWILEHNDMMNRSLEHINSKVYKKYRIYEMNI